MPIRNPYKKPSKSFSRFVAQHTPLKERKYVVVKLDGIRTYTLKEKHVDKAGRVAWWQVVEDKISEANGFRKSKTILTHGNTQATVVDFRPRYNNLAVDVKKTEATDVFTRNGKRYIRFLTSHGQLAFIKNHAGVFHVGVIENLRETKKRLYFDIKVYICPWERVRGPIGFGAWDDGYTISKP